MKTKSTYACLLVVAALITTGCESKTSTVDNAANEPGTHTHADGTVHKNNEGEHDHSHDDPPHDGTIAMWGGGKIHLEFTVDHDKKEATIYVLADNVKDSMPIETDEIELSIKDPAFQVTLAANPLESDPDGTCSRFTGTHENIGIVKEFEGTIFGSIGDKPYSVDFKELPHDHE